jgi:DNA-binding GntR family transcriptional regulator
MNGSPMTCLPGQRIRRAVLTHTLAVSRQPVSHALQLVKCQGSVEAWNSP